MVRFITKNGKKIPIDDNRRSKGKGNNDKSGGMKIGKGTKVPKIDPDDITLTEKQFEDILKATGLKPLRADTDPDVFFDEDKTRNISLHPTNSDLDNIVVTNENFESAVGKLIDKETEERIDNLSEDEFDDYLEDNPSVLDNFSHSELLRESDPTAYRTGLNDYVDGVVRDEERELEKKAEEEVDDDFESFGLKEKDRNEDPYFEAIEKRKDELTEERIDELHDDTEMYDQTLDEVGSSESIGGGVGNVLREVDPTAYRTEFADWSDGERDRIRDEVANEIDEEESIRSGGFT